MESQTNIAAPPPPGQNPMVPAQPAPGGAPPAAPAPTPAPAQLSGAPVPPASAIPSAPEAPKYEQPPAYTPHQQDAEGLKNTFGMLMAASMMMGAASRGPYNNAMTSMTGVMQGITAADHEAAKQHLDEYGRQLDAINERNRLRKLEYDEAWNKYKNDYSKLSQQMLLTAVKHGDEVAADLINRGQLSAGMAHLSTAIDTHNKAIEKAKATRASMQGMLDASQVPEAERHLAVQMWLQNRSMRGMSPVYQKNVLKWAADMGITESDMQHGVAQAKFDQATAVTAGHRAGVMAAIEKSMPGLVDNAIEASRKIPRSKFVPANKLEQIGLSNISDPDLIPFLTAHQAVVSEYQQVIARGGTNVASLNEAMKLLRTADSPETYEKNLRMVEKEIGILVKGTQAVREEIGITPTARAPSASPPRTNAKGWTLHTDKNGNRAYVSPDGKQYEEVR